MAKATKQRNSLTLSMEQVNENQRRLIINLKDQLNIRDLQVEDARSERDACADSLKQEQEWNDDKAHRIEALMTEVQGLHNLYDQKKADYEYRHNQCLAHGQTISDLRRENSELRFELSAFKNDVTRLLFLSAFDCGTENEQMVTRCRNRLINELAPLPARGKHVDEDNTIQLKPSLESLETVGQTS